MIPATEPPSSRAARERAILRATIEELAWSDYGGLSFERVAARAGVNKTTVYRRWETKADLVRAALTSVVQSLRPGPTTGSLRGDLVRIGRAVREFIASFEGQCLMRVRLLEHPEPELAAMAKELHARSLGDIASLGRAAVERGELASQADMMLLVEMLSGSLHTRLMMKNEPAGDVVIARYVDVLLRGAAGLRGQAQPAVAKRKAGKAAGRTAR
ncbi:MAG TPA: TetR/AcrR family transcriptional regulator [Polyangiaceae bacterium]